MYKSFVSLGKYIPKWQNSLQIKKKKIQSK